MKVLYCTTVLPSQRRTGGEIASQSFIDALRRAGHRVSVLGYQRPNETRPLGLDEVLISERPIESDTAGARSLTWMLAALLKGHPYSCEKYVSEDYLATLKKHIAGDSRCVVILDHAQVAFLAGKLPASIPVVFVAHNVESELYRSQVTLQKSHLRRWLLRREALLIERLEVSLANRASQTWVLTEHDASTFRDKAKSANVIRCDLPGIADSIDAPPTIQIDWDLGLIGTWSWSANAEGLRWFMERVVPLLPANLKIGVAGKGSENIVKAPVTSLGFVPAAMDFMRSCQVVCIPSTAGGGVQIKTIDAIASGRPIVATSIALRGIEDTPASVSMLDKPEDFAARIIQLASREEPHSDSAVGWAQQRKAKFDLRIGTLIKQIGVE